VSPQPPRPLAEFLAEAGEIVESLSRDLLTLDQRREESPDPDRLNAIFRGAHSIKGLAGLFGQDAIQQLAHRAEDLLDRLRLGKTALTGDVLDALIDCLDVFQQLLAAAAGERDEAEARESAEALATRLETLGTTKKRARKDPLDKLELDPQIRAVLTEYEEHRLRENLKAKAQFFKVKVSFPLSDFDVRLTGLSAKLKEKGEVLSTLPGGMAEGGDQIGFELLFASKREAGEIEPLAREAGGTLEPLRTKEPRKVETAPTAEPVETVELEPEERDTELSELPRPESRPESLRSLTQTVRVDIRRLDVLMNSVGELIRIRANLQRLAELARAPETATARQLGQELQRETRQLERKLDELQKGLLGARMVPLAQVFEKLSRLVRRYAKDSGKEIGFTTRGGEVELDKLIVEDLSDPLMHLIRNAIDHGIERPDVRAKAGKPRKGELRLVAEQKGGHVAIEVRDDGAGVDLARVREIGVTRGLISAAQAKDASERDLLNLLFAPGFSTASTVSELSGRGVGLDVVKTNISRLSGIIDVLSTRGRGTTFTLTLPVTLAIVRALIVSVSGRTYAVPLASVLEILSVVPEEIRTIERREVLSVRGQTLPLTRLARLFGLPEGPPGRMFVVVIGLAQERLGLAIGELHGQQDIVIKPLGQRLRDVRGIAGATELGNRRTVLVLDVGAILEEVLHPAEARVASIG
jgi:two-component system chemotaxis sensor kinase CheA